MGAAFVKRRMQAELGTAWQDQFEAFDLRPAAAASLGQVHKATTLQGAAVACKLQYADMQSAVEADLKQLDWLFSLHRQLSSAIDTSEIKREIGDRLREELDYAREAKNAALYAAILTSSDKVRVPRVHGDLSTRRLLTLDWLEGEKLLAFKDADETVRNRLAEAMFEAWWLPMARYGVIHGDPHLGNYSVFRDAAGQPSGINLLDYGCIRIFPAKFASGVVELYRGFRREDHDQIVHAYELWGFERLDKELIDTLSIWRASSTRRCSRIGCARWPTASRRASTGGARPSSCIRRFASAARSRCRASSSSWTVRRSGSAACSCTSARSSISTACSKR